MRRESPDGYFRGKVFFEVSFPDKIARLDIQATEITFAAKDVHAIAVHRRRASRSGRVGNAVGAVIRMLPKLSAAGRIECNQSFLAAQIRSLAGVIERLAPFLFVVKNEDSPVGGGGTGIATGDGNTPFDAQAVCRHLVDDSRFAVNSVAGFSHPAGPVFAHRRSAIDENHGRPCKWRRPRADRMDRDVMIFTRKFFRGMTVPFVIQFSDLTTQ